MAGDRPGPQENEHHEGHAGDQRRQAGDDQILAEQREPLGEEDREQRRTAVRPVGDPQLPVGQPGLGGKKVIELVEMSDMVQMRQSHREREGSQQERRKPGRSIDRPDLRAQSRPTRCHSFLTRHCRRRQPGHLALLEFRCPICTIIGVRGNRLRSTHVHRDSGS